MENEATVLIVGAGTFGVSIAYHLSRSYEDGSRLTILDRFPSPPTPAAAIDINRVIRTDYGNPLYCDLAFEALHDWFWKLELQRFFHGVGWLYLNENGNDLSKQVRETRLSRGSIDVEDIALDKLETRWNGVLAGTKTDGFDDAYFNKEAGWCDAAGATASLMSAALDRGVTRLQADVAELVLDADGGKLKGVRTTDGMEHAADKIILAAGAWTSALLSPVEDTLSMPSSERVERQIQATGAVAAYYRVSPEEVSRAEDSNTPILVYGQRGEVIPPSKDNKLVKVSNTKGTFTNTITTKSGQKISKPRSGSAENQREVPKSLKDEMSELMTANVMTKILNEKEPEYWRVCWDALTLTEDWLMCKHPHSKLQNLFLAVGGSFHSYK